VELSRGSFIDDYFTFYIKILKSRFLYFIDFFLVSFYVLSHSSLNLLSSLLQFMTSPPSLSPLFFIFIFSSLFIFLSPSYFSLFLSPSLLFSFFSPLPSFSPFLSRALLSPSFYLPLFFLPLCLYLSSLSHFLSLSLLYPSLSSLSLPFFFSPSLSLLSTICCLIKLEWCVSVLNAVSSLQVLTR